MEASGVNRKEPEEEQIINCVAIFYDEGKGGEDFRKKNKFRCKVRDWASSYGAAVRQRTVRQETTMARHGTLPEFMHQRQCEVAEKPISIAFDAQVSTAEAVTENETVEEAEDEFDESSDEEVDDDPEVSTLVQGKIGSSATFLLGARTRFGRVVRFNNDRRIVSLDDGSLRFR